MASGNTCMHILNSNNNFKAKNYDDSIWHHWDYGKGTISDAIWHYWDYGKGTVSDAIWHHWGNAKGR